MSFACRRVILIVLDGVGVGALPDAERFGDAGADTLGHVAAASGPLQLPNLQRLGLGNIHPVPGVPPAADPEACWGRMAELSSGKDTTAGHWELAGLPTLEPFATYPHGFPAEIMAEFSQVAGVEALGNVAASGTDIIRDLGEEHLRTGRPIVYTSTDSVFQIAAHEEVVPLPRLYEICRMMRQRLDPYRIGRIIARPFVGSSAATFTRTAHRHDYSMLPSGETLLDILQRAGVPVTAVGKISDIFAGRGVDESFPTRDNKEGMQKVSELVKSGREGLVFANLVDFDMLYGHRLDTAGFARALQEFDAWLPELEQLLQPDDLLLLTADHGCDPLHPGTDHTREFVPLLAKRPGLRGRRVGVRESFSDVAATIAEVLGVSAAAGKSFVDLMNGLRD